MSETASDLKANIIGHAARRMREQHGPEHERHAMWEAIASWLSAKRLQDYRPGRLPQLDVEFAAALKVARAYLAADEDVKP